MISDACSPTMWAPRISPYFLSRRIFTNPSVSPVPRARPFAENGNRATRGHQHRRDLDLLRRAVRFDLEGHFILSRGTLLHLGCGDHLDAPLLVALREGVRGLGVLERQDAGERFDQGHLGAEGVEDV